MRPITARHSQGQAFLLLKVRDEPDGTVLV